MLVIGNIGKTKKEAEQASIKIIEKIAAAIKLPVVFEDYQHGCTASIGICLFDDDSLDAAELLRRADVSMYLSKKQGRNAYQLYDADLEPHYEYELKLKHELNHVLDVNQLELYLQGQYDQHSNMTGAEALLRWNHPELGSVMPNDFIPLAEETGAIIPIGNWVLNQACAMLKRWQVDDASSNLTISINVSAIQFNHPEFIQQVQSAITQSGCDATKLCIELTESAIITNLDESV